MSQINWDDSLKRGLAFQDQDHQDSVALMNDLQTCSDQDFPNIFALHVQHLTDHLNRENELMDRINFFAKDMHIAEHARVIAETADMQAKLAAGDLAAVRAYATGPLPQWFMDHLESMDTMTAQFALQMGES